MYKVIWKDKAERDLGRIDKKMAQNIFKKVETYLAKDPIKQRQTFGL